MRVVRHPHFNKRKEVITMTVAEALEGPFNHLGYQLGLQIAKTFEKYHIVNTDAVTTMFISACGGDDLSSVPAYIAEVQSLELFTHAVALSLQKFSISLTEEV